MLRLRVADQRQLGPLLIRAPTTLIVSISVRNRNALRAALVVCCLRHFGEESSRLDFAPFRECASRHGATSAEWEKNNAAIQRRKRVHRRTSGVARAKRHRARTEEGC